MSSSCSTCNSSSCDARVKKPGEAEKEFQDRQNLKNKLCNIKNKILVLSGKGGVGKSTVASKLALSLAKSGNKVGLLDIDVHGPSIPVMLGVRSEKLTISEDGEMVPVEYSENLKVMSTGFLVKSENQAVIWRGPMKYNAIKQFISDVAWGELDYLVVDSPPGTGDEPLAIAQIIDDVTGVVIVTTPQEVAVSDVRKCIDFCENLKLPIVGIVENMSGFTCPHCGKVTEIFNSGGGKLLSELFKIPLLTQIPIDPLVVLGGDSGKSLDDENSIISEKFGEVVEKLEKFVEK